jgi:hypothetical protein
MHKLGFLEVSSLKTSAVIVFKFSVIIESSNVSGGSLFLSFYVHVIRLVIRLSSALSIVDLRVSMHQKT